MLRINVPSIEKFNESTNEFISSPGGELQLEHSLVSVRKWEEKWHIPFLTKDEKTEEQMMDYIRCMTLNHVNPGIYDSLTRNEVNQIQKYIDDPMTATTFGEEKKKNSREIITNEIIYYWMVSFNIPFECEKWHLNRLMTLIRVCSIKNTPQKKMSTREVMARNKALNKARKAQLHTRG